ncbi:MAG: hypothetical protein HC831_21285 [Chloroflexia bacterium]|nr:hypothetical protein [Chloroflexia bacterium]
MVLILYQLVGYYSIHQLQLCRVRKEVKKQIKSNIPQNQLTIIQFSLFEINTINWVKKDKEFIYKGEMYDVVKVNKLNNATTFYCIADFKETRLFAKLDDFVNQFMASKLRKTKEKTSKVFSLFQFEYLLQEQSATTPQLTINNGLNPFFKIQNYLAFLDNESPPPKLYF